MTPPAPNADRPARILIADDNPQGAELLEAYLADTDYEVRTAADGEQTLRQVAEWQPDLILLDIMMPRISGFEVCKRLRADPATRDIAVLMITALDQPSDIDRAVEAGTDDFLSKPINKSGLLLRVSSLLRSRHGKRDLDRALNYIEAVEREDVMEGEAWSVEGKGTPNPPPRSPPFTRMGQVILLPKRARPFYGRHPWVYAGAIGDVAGEPADGDEVDLVAHTGQLRGARAVQRQ